MEMLLANEGSSFITAGSCIGGGGLKPKRLASGHELSHRVPSRASGELGVSCLPPHPTVMQEGPGLCAICRGYELRLL